MNFLDFIKNIYKKYYQDEVPSMSAQTSFFVILSFIPFLIYILTVISNLNLPEQNVYIYLQSILPQDTYQSIVGIIEEILSRNDVSVYSILFTLYFASKGSKGIIVALNKAYNEREHRNIIVLIIMSLLFTVIVAFLLAIALIALVFGRQISEKLFQTIYLQSHFIIIWEYLRHLLTIFFMLIIFTIIYKHAPSCKLAIKDVIPGSLFTTFSWTLVSGIFAYYMNNFNTSYASLYGSLSGIFALLIWLYISSTIIILGGEINAYILKNKKNKKWYR
ncbi:MAG: YihY/virulence factor BrkB family protein [Eubacteriales bacterium]